MLQIPTFAMSEFLEIINAYGSFIKEREIVKNFNKDNYLNQTINNEVEDLIEDFWTFREHGISSGISESKATNLVNTVDNTISLEKDRLVKNMISSQKYYKKLKHKFKEMYPDLIETFEKNMSEHQTYMETKKREQHQKFNSIVAFSSRFVAFFNYNFQGGLGAKIAYNAFAKSICKKTNNLTLTNKEINEFHNNFGRSFNKTSAYVLTISEIERLFMALDCFVKNVTDEDLECLENYITNTEDENLSLEDKKQIAGSIISKNVKRFRKLHSDYLEINK